MKPSSLLGPLRVRFTQPEDIAIYGDGWFVYSERDITRKPARELVEIEQQIGVPLIDAMNDLRRSSVFGDLVGAWIAVREHDPKLAGEFEDFSPLIMFAEWEEVPKDEGKGEGETPLSRPPTMMPTHVLQTLPVVE